MPSLSKTFLVAVAATGAVASVDHQLVRRELLDAIDNDLVTRDEAEHMLGIWAREVDEEPLVLTRDIVDQEIEDALYTRSEYEHLDDIYARDLDTRDLQIRSDIEAVFHDEGLFARDLDQEDAVLRVRELAARDPELFQLYRRGVKMTSFLGAVGGAMVAGKGNRMKGAAIGGGLGFVAHKAAKGIKSMTSGGKKGKRGGGGGLMGMLTGGGGGDDDDHHNSKRNYQDNSDYLGGYGGGDGGEEYRRRDIDDPEIYDW